MAYALIPLVVGVLVALAALCGLPRERNPYFSDRDTPCR